MIKIAINTCFGGFGLSDKAIERYAELKEISLVKEKGSHIFNSYYKQAGEIFSSSEIPRDDPLLLQVIKELGEEANGSFADLSIVEIPNGVNWEIAEYDGTEHVAEKHRTWY